MAWPRAVHQGVSGGLTLKGSCHSAPRGGTRADGRMASTTQDHMSILTPRVTIGASARAPVDRELLRPVCAEGLVTGEERLMARRRDIEVMLRSAIQEGRLNAGARIPSTRTLAAELGVARGTVLSAYAQLAAEGWIVSRPGAPTTVAHRAEQATNSTTRAGAVERRFRFDLRPGDPDLSTFPLKPWLAALERAARRGPAALGYGDHQGAPELREALAAYLARARGVVADPTHIVIVSGISEAMATIGAALAPGPVAMEDPGLDYFRDIVATAGATVEPLEVDEEGALGDPGPVDAAIVTPAHQYPLGVTLSLQRRHALIAWARHRGAVLIEDDYDGEFRFEREPVGAMQGSAPEHVIYLGTASKSLAPGLRIAWAVLPDRWLDRFLRLRWARPTVPYLDQFAMGQLIGSGEFDRHLRQRRAVYRERRDDLERMVGALGGGLRLRGVAAGLHAVVELPTPGPDERRVREEALRLSVGIDTLRRHWHGEPRFSGIIVGYSRPPNHAWRAALEALRETLARAIGRPSD